MKTPWQKLFDPNYMGSWSLEEGEELTTTVTKVEKVKVRSMEGVEKLKAVIYLDKAPANGLLLPMIIGNKENARTMTELSGTNLVEDWGGTKIVIFIKKGVRSPTGPVDALRIKAPPKKEGLTADKFTKMLQSIQDGKYTAEQAQNRFALTPEQIEQL